MTKNEMIDQWHIEMQKIWAASSVPFKAEHRVLETRLRWCKEWREAALTIGEDEDDNGR